MSSNRLCDTAERTKILVCGTQCRHGQSSGNCSSNHQLVRALEDLRREKGDSGTFRQDAKAKTGATKVIQAETG